MLEHITQAYPLPAASARHPIVTTELPRTPEFIQFGVVRGWTREDVVVFTIPNYTKLAKREGIAICPAFLLAWLLHADPDGRKMAASFKVFEKSFTPAQRNTIRDNVLDLVTEFHEKSGLLAAFKLKRHDFLVKSNNLTGRAAARAFLLFCSLHDTFPLGLHYVQRDSESYHGGRPLLPLQDLREKSRKGWVELFVGDLNIIEGVTHVVNSSDTPEQMRRAYRSCAHCGIMGVRVSKCDECKSTCYCCRDHQLIDWRRHKLICSGRKSRVLKAIERLVRAGSRNWKAVYSARWHHA